MRGSSRRAWRRTCDVWEKKACVQTFNWSCIHIQHFYLPHKHPDLSNIKQIIATKFSQKIILIQIKGGGGILLQIMQHFTSNCLRNVSLTFFLDNFNQTRSKECQKKVQKSTVWMKLSLKSYCPSMQMEKETHTVKSKHIQLILKMHLNLFEDQTFTKV